MDGVITNGNHDQQLRKIKTIGLESLLERTYSSELMGHAKPTDTAFLLPSERLGVLPGRALYVGDNYRVDIQGARAAGLHAIHLDRAGFGHT